MPSQTEHQAPPEVDHGEENVVRGTLVTQHSVKIRDCRRCKAAPQHWFSPRDPREHVVYCPSCGQIDRDSSQDALVARWNRRQRGLKPVCRHVRASSVVPGWGCCRCQSYNGYQRQACRQCGHAPCFDTSGDLGREAAELRKIGHDDVLVTRWMEERARRTALDDVDGAPPQN
jgi:hypothetical protein